MRNTLDLDFIQIQIVRSRVLHILEEGQDTLHGYPQDFFPLASKRGDAPPFHLNIFFFSRHVPDISSIEYWVQCLQQFPLSWCGPLIKKPKHSPNENQQVPMWNGAFRSNPNGVQNHFPVKKPPFSGGFPSPPDLISEKVYHDVIDLFPVHVHAWQVQPQQHPPSSATMMLLPAWELRSCGPSKYVDLLNENKSGRGRILKAIN